VGSTLRGAPVAAIASSPAHGSQLTPPGLRCSRGLASVGYPKENKWNDQVNCYGACAGSVGSKTNPNGFCPGETQFPAPSKYTGFGKYLWEWSIMDKVIIPDSLDAGNYLLSWYGPCRVLPHPARLPLCCACVHV